MDFSAVQSGETLTVSVSKALNQPVIYRIGRWPDTPSSVDTTGGVLKVNQGGTAPHLDSEADVNGSSSDAWYYDSAAKRLVVKVIAPGVIEKGTLP